MNRDPVAARSGAWHELQAMSLDVLVIGGGIVGAGVARDAAMRGLRVGLIEQQDFASGTSSRSSRLLHGGLRYLAQGNIRLVREASREKCVISQIAPHLVEPLAFVFPASRGSGWPLWQMHVGVTIYDWLCGGANFGPSGRMSLRQVRQALPFLETGNLTGAVRYFDALTNDSRLVIDTLRSARHAGAILLNHARFSNARQEGGGWRSEILDKFGGISAIVRSRVVVNATGPWADRIPHSTIRLRCTKGIHLVVDRARIPTKEAIAVSDHKRLLFLIPWGERLILGTTDTEHRDSPECASVDEIDVRYLLAAVNRLVPGAQLVPGDIVSSWAGIRPLLAGDDGEPSDISRTHLIRHSHPGWWDVAGGKLTTYRLMAEQVIDRVAQELGVVGRECPTAKQPLPAAEPVQEASGILPPPIDGAVVDYYCRREWALHVGDVMTRRSGWRHYHRNSDAIARQVLDWMGDLFGWSSAVRKGEWNRYLAER